ncbi:MAG: HU family DNA-binding protein [Rickettsiaceae bacterium]
MATKKDLVRQLVQNLSYLSEEDANYAVNCILEYIKGELAKGNRIELRGFGSLSIRKRKQANHNAEYNTIYYRMSRNVQDSLSSSS